MKLIMEKISVTTANCPLNIAKLMTLNIPDLAPIYGGIRGRTMSSRHQSYAWPIIKECGIHTIIDLRADGIRSHLSEICEKYGMKYFHYPIDLEASSIEHAVKYFPQLCEIIDAGNFYISCAMGLHRTAIALCCYWIFYGASKGMSAPDIRGYREKDGHDVNKIMRVVNAFYKCMSAMTGEAPFTLETLNRRKKIITEKARSQIIV